MTDATIQLGIILGCLNRMIAARASKQWSFIPLVVTLWGRLNRTLRRFEILVAKIRAGQLPPPPRPARTTVRKPKVLPDPSVPLPYNIRLPTGFNWLGKRMIETNPFGGQLQHLMTHNEEMKALLAADPRVARLLRPLCRMLGVDPATAGLPPPPPRRAPVAVVKRAGTSPTAPPPAVASADHGSTGAAGPVLARFGRSPLRLSGQRGPPGPFRPKLAVVAARP